MEEPVRVTLNQQESIAHDLSERYHQNGYPVIIHSEPFYERSIKYLTEQLGVKVAPWEANKQYLHANYFIILWQKNQAK